MSVTLRYFNRVGPKEPVFRASNHYMPFSRPKSEVWAVRTYIALLIGRRQLLADIHRWIDQ